MKNSPTGHTFNGSFTITKKPTCTEEGIRAAICTRCGATLMETPIPVIEHTWSEWEVVEEPTENEAGRRERTCEVCGEVEEEILNEPAELTVEDCGNSTFFFCSNGDLDDIYSYLVSYYKVDQNTGEIIGGTRLLLRFNTNVDWSVSAPSNVHVVDENGNAHYSGSAGDNYIIVYMDEIPYSTQTDTAGPFTLTITANEESASYNLEQCNRIHNGLGKEDYLESIANLLSIVSPNSDAVDAISGNVLTNGNIVEYQIDDFKRLAVKSEQTSYNEIYIDYILYQVEINRQPNNTKARLEVISSDGLKISQGSAPIFRTNGTINCGLVDSTDEVYEREVKVGNTILWGVSTSISFLLGFIDGPSPVADFAIGVVVDTVVESAGTAIISVSTKDNGDEGVETTTTYTLNGGCTLAGRNDKIEMTCDNNNSATTSVTINWIVTDGDGASIPGTQSN